MSTFSILQISIRLAKLSQQLI